MCTLTHVAFYTIDLPSCGRSRHAFWLRVSTSDKLAIMFSREHKVKLNQAFHVQQGKFDSWFTFHVHSSPKSHLNHLTMLSYKSYMQSNMLSYNMQSYMLSYKSYMQSYMLSYKSYVQSYMLSYNMQSYMLSYKSYVQSYMLSYKSYMRSTCCPTSHACAVLSYMLSYKSYKQSYMLSYKHACAVL
jgi:hypothetical protein